jgi:hypothetical protein
MIKEFKKFENIEHFKNLLKEFDKFNYKKGEYAIFGSGPLAIRGYIKAHDVDVIVKDSAWRYGDKDKIKIGNIEFLKSWPNENINKLIYNADIIYDRPYVKLNKVLKYKLEMNRKKDIHHINLLKKLL